MRYIFVFAFAITICSCKGQTNTNIPVSLDENSLLWKISGNNIKAESFLYGTFHLMCKDDIIFSKYVRPAIATTDVVYFEMDLDDPATLLGGIFFMNMKDSTLPQLLPEEQYAKLSSYFKDSLGMDLKNFNKFKPTMLEALLYPKMLGCKTTSGVEQELVKIVKTYKKEILGFETIQEQSAVFDSIPYRLQAQSLFKAIDSMRVNQKDFNKMVNEYKQQHLSALMETEATDDELLENYLPLLLDNRNKNWVKQLKNILPKKSVFVAVGAGHLSGEKGLINLLKKAGYTVQPVAKN